MGRPACQAGSVPGQQPQQAATGDLPDAAASDIVSVSAAARYWQAVGAEVDAFETLAAAPPHGLGDLPVIIVSAGRDVPNAPPIREAIDDLHHELASRTPRTSHHIVEDADHLTLLTVDEHARAVSEVIAQRLPQAVDD